MSYDETFNTIRFKTLYPTFEKFNTDYEVYGLYTPTISLEDVYKRLFAKFANRQIRYIGVDYFKQSFLYDLGVELTDFDFKVANEITSVDKESVTTVVKEVTNTQSSDLITKESPQDLDITLYDSRKESEDLSSSNNENVTTTVKDKDRLEIQSKLNQFTKNYFSIIFTNLLKHFSMNDYYESEEIYI